MRMMIVRRRQLIPHSVAVAAQRGQRTLQIGGAPCTCLVRHIFGEFLLLWKTVEICKKKEEKIVIRKVNKLDDVVLLLNSI